MQHYTSHSMDSEQAIRRDDDVSCKRKVASL